MLQVKNKFMSIFHHKQEKYTFVELVWTKYTEEMTVLEYRECVQKYLEIMLSIKPKQVLIETKLFFFSISPDIQKWIIESITPKTLEAGLERMALVVTENFFGQLSIEQTMENPAPNFNVRYFDSRDSALSWIREGNVKSE